ncbi:MAG: cbb3-type cytochrome oxidase assembly protein CcoS [Ectothiorhodospiraceae bacterium]|nr:cbb3-type cytochrome oxidase assembly protein CcoS [Ectothiorhodospiraceae bacterium]
MNIIFISIPISLVLVAIGVAAFFWAVRSGQFDDLDSPAYSILMDDEDKPRRNRKAGASAQQTGQDDNHSKRTKDEPNDH